MAAERARGPRWKLFTHTDLDGAGCAVLCRLAVNTLGGDLDVEHLATPADLDARLRELMDGDDLGGFDHVLITDLRCARRFLEHWRAPKLILVDHHRTALELSDLPNARVEVEVDGRQTCATELVHRLLVSAGFVTPRPFFTEMVRLYDTWAWTKLAPFRLPAHLSALVYTLGIEEFERRMATRLAAGDADELTLLTHDEVVAVHTQAAADDRFVTERLKFVHVDTLDHGLRVGTVLADRCASTLGHRICAELGADVAVVVDPLRGRVSLRTNRDDLDLSDLARWRFTGGGHAQAAGGATDDVVAGALAQVYGWAARQVAAWTSREGDAQ